MTTPKYKTYPPPSDTCSVCGKPIVGCLNYRKYKLGAIVQDVPGEIELVKRVPFIGPTARIVRSELELVGVNYEDLVVTCLMKHAIDENCVVAHYRAMLQEIKRCKVVLVLGSFGVDYLFGQSLNTLSGTVIETDRYKGKVFVAGPSPMSVLRGSVGEWRLAIRTFAHALEEAKNAHKK